MKISRNRVVLFIIYVIRVKYIYIYICLFETTERKRGVFSTTCIRTRILVNYEDAFYR